MNIKIKKLKTFQGNETLIKTCDIYINNKYVGTAFDDGNGGDLDLNFYEAHKKQELVELVDKAYAWAESLPDKKIVINNDSGRTLTIKMDLANVIDDLILAELKRKEDKKFAELSKCAILYGVPNGFSYKIVSWKNSTLKIVAAHPKGLEILQTQINKIKENFNEGEVFLNKEYLESLGVVC